MFDIALRPLKDRIFDQTCRLIPSYVEPGHLTLAALIAGLLSCVAVTQGSTSLAVTLWLLNRVLDCLDGAVARQRNQASDLGGFLDLLGDFIIYSLIPIACGLGIGSNGCAFGIMRLWTAIACAEASFHVNNFVLFYIAAVTEKQKATEASAAGEKGAGKGDGVKVKELTSLSMRPALVEGAESGMVFTVMLLRAEWTEPLCWILSLGVVAGTIQRVYWVVHVL